MKEDVNDALLRQFLLGKANNEVREQIESLFLTESAMRERVLAAEQDLIEDYLEDSLTVEDKERFVLRYAQTPAQQRKLRITRSIKDWALTKSEAASYAEVNVGRSSSQDGTNSVLLKESSVSAWLRIRERLRTRPTLLIPIAALTVLAIVFGIILINRWREQRRHFAIEQELARLNSPSSLRQTLAGLEPVTLTPVTLRSGGSSPDVNPRPEMPFVELRLLWIQSQQYPSYRAVLRRLRDEESFTIPAVRTAEGDAKTIRLRLPADLLARGTYLIQLTGIGPDGSTGVTEEYQFVVHG